MNKIESKVFNKKRYCVLITSIIAVFIVFVSRLVDWQIINSEYYKLRANSSNIYFVTTDPVRGEILDCNGVGLAVNDTGYKVVIDRLLIEKGKENEFILKSVKFLESLNCQWIDLLPISLKNNQFLFEDGKDTQSKSLKNTLKLSPEASASECMDEMVKKYKAEDFSKSEQRIICSVRLNMEKNGMHHSKATPYVLADSVSKEAVTVINEKFEEYRGLRIQTSLLRRYINGEVAPHIVGYTGFMSPEEYEKLKDKYAMDAVIGKAGIESVFEDYLRGIGGKRMIQMSRDGQVMDVSEREPAQSGNTVHLTISSKIQQVANESLKRNVEAAHRGAADCCSGAAVVLNVKDFSVLAASTYPSYDLARFMEDRSYYSELAKDKAVPLLNRAFMGAYAPGSVYKPLVACAALESGKITPDEPIHCCGSFNYYTGYRLKCMGVHGNVKLRNALAKSCNVYFAELGRRLGAELLGGFAKKFGIGVKTGVEISESKGVLAGPEHCENVGAKWYESGSSQAAIGQSDNMLTPIQLAAYTATIANGGKRYKTHLVNKITDYSRAKVVREYTPELVEDVGISEENLNAVKEGMREVALSGTARDFSSYPVPIAAKTGTAQNSGSDHTTFICFAPYDDPQIAISVVIAHGKSGLVSKNVARDIMNEYFGLNSQK